MNNSKKQLFSIVTGSSSGIGVELARQFAKDGKNLVLIARRRDRLEAVAKELTAQYKIQCEVIAEDITSEGAVDRILKILNEKSIQVEALVNNAGFGLQGEFAKISRSKQLGMIDLNIRALVDFTHAVLPQMVERKSGYILNVGSLAGFQPGPYMTVYYATKAFVNSFSEGLSVELAPYNIKVSALCPGFTATEFADAAGLDQEKLKRFKAMTALEVAQDGYNGMKKGKVIVIPGFGYRALVQSLRISPRSAVRNLAGKINRGI